MAITKAALARAAAREAAIARRAAQGEGGRKGWVERDPDAALAARQKAASAVNGPAGLARRLAKRWPQLSDAEQAEVLAILTDAGVIAARHATTAIPWQEPEAAR